MKASPSWRISSRHTHTHTHTHIHCWIFDKIVICECYTDIVNYAWLCYQLTNAMSPLILKTELNRISKGRASHEMTSFTRRKLVLFHTKVTSEIIDQLNQKEEGSVHSLHITPKAYISLTTGINSSRHQR